jgi:hypothetical protein
MTRRAGSRTPCPARTALAPAPAPERKSDDAPLVRRDWQSNAGTFSPGYHARACHVRRACRVYLGVVAGRHAPAYVLRCDRAWARPLPQRSQSWRNSPACRRSISKTVFRARGGDEIPSTPLEAGLSLFRKRETALSIVLALEALPN